MEQLPRATRVTPVGSIALEFPADERPMRLLTTRRKTPILFRVSASASAWKGTEAIRAGRGMHPTTRGKHRVT
jgi:hypothetical protein